MTDHWLARVVTRLSRWRTGTVTEDPAALARSLRELALDPVDLRRAREGSERDLHRMMQRFGLDPDSLPTGWLASLRDAERACAQCLEVGRCRRFFASDEGPEAARNFCPNAEIFEDMAERLRKSAAR